MRHLLRRAFPVLLLTAWVVAPAAPAAAGTIPGPVDDSLVGRHSLIDTSEYPGAECREQGLVLERIKVRRPVMFARDRTGRVDTQVVGWRWQLRTSAFTLVDQGPIEKTTGSDRRAAPFKPATIDMTGRDDIQYFVSIRMLWYTPGSSTQVQAAAVHHVRLYLHGGFVFGSGCGAGGVGIARETPPDHTGDYGVHILLDNEHLSPVVCDYDSVSGEIKGVRARGPIVLAFDTGAGVQAQDVSWRLRVQSTDDLDPDKNTVWTDLPVVMGFLSAVASERRPAGFAARTRNLAPGERGAANYRVRVIVRWLRPNGSVDGHVIETARAYDIVKEGVSQGVTTAACPGIIPV
jgi:hypothetical protein